MTAISTNITTPVWPERAVVATFRADRLAHYIALYGKDCTLAHDNADADTHMRFRNVEYGRAVMSLFSMARAGGPDFILGGEG